MINNAINMTVLDIIIKFTFVAFYILFTGILAVKQETCSGKIFKAECPRNDVVWIDRASYGRMELGSCVARDYGHLGCVNDVRDVVSNICSGREMCTIELPEDLEGHNTNCPKDLVQYLSVEYHCLQVVKPETQRCTKGQRSNLNDRHGFLSSHVTQQTGCGAPGAPWAIHGQPGQNIQLQLLDFANTEKSTLSIGCVRSLGYIVEKTLNVNKTICSGVNGDALYKSKTNQIELSIFKNQEIQEHVFLIEYTVIGCSEIVPSPHSWYRREGDSAVIGCKNNERKWELHCNGESWEGDIGNCSSTTNVATNLAELKDPKEMTLTSIILLTGVVCAAVLLIFLVVVAGTVYIKKQSIKHSVKLRSEYGTATLPTTYSTSKNPGYDVNTFKSDMTSSAPNHGHEDNQPLVHIWERTLPDPNKPTMNNPFGSNVPGYPSGTSQRPAQTLEQRDLLH